MNGYWVGGEFFPDGEFALPLEGCHAKLERACDHFAQLDHELAEFFDSNPYAAIGELKPDGCWYSLKVKVVRQPPPHLGVILGEFVHQLRSSLDHAAYEAARQHLGHKPPETIGFPIDTSESAYTRKEPRKLANREGPVVSERFRALVRAVQPYQRGDARHDDPLAILERLWNLDKHQTVIPVPVTQSIGTGHPVFSTGPDTALVEPRLRTFVRLEPQAELALIRVATAARDPKVYMDSEALVAVEGVRGPRLMLELGTIFLVVAGLISTLAAKPPGYPSVPAGWPLAGLYRTRIRSV